MTELALAEALLDLSALLQIGVRVVVISTGDGEAEISQRLVDGELKWGCSSMDTPGAHLRSPKSRAASADQRSRSGTT